MRLQAWVSRSTRHSAQGRICTSVFSTLLKVVDTLSVVALAHLFSHQSSHHDLNPLFTNDSISGVCYSFTVAQIDTLERGRDSWLLSEEGLGLGSRHAELL